MANPSGSGDFKVTMIAAGKTGLKAFDRLSAEEVATALSGIEVLDVRSCGAGQHFVALSVTGISVGQWDEQASPMLRWEDRANPNARSIDVVDSDSGGLLFFLKSDSRVAVTIPSTMSLFRETKPVLRAPVAVAAVGLRGSFVVGLEHHGIQVYPRTGDNWTNLKPPSDQDTMTDLRSCVASEVLGACFESGTVATYDVAHMKPVVALKAHVKSAARKLALSSVNSKLVATGADDGFVHLISLDSSKVLFKLKCEAAVTSVSFCADEPGAVWAGNAAGVVRVWDLRQAKQPLQVIPHAQDGPVEALAFMRRHRPPPALEQIFASVAEPEPESESAPVPQSPVLVLPKLDVPSASTDERDIRSPAAAAAADDADADSDLVSLVAERNSPLSMPRNTDASPARAIDFSPSLASTPSATSTGDSGITKTSPSSPGLPTAEPSTLSLSSLSASADARSSTLDSEQATGNVSSVALGLAHQVSRATAYQHCSCQCSGVLGPDELQSIIPVSLFETLPAPGPAPAPAPAPAAAAVGAGQAANADQGGADVDGVASGGSAGSPGFTPDQINTLERVVGTMVHICLRSHFRPIMDSLEQLRADVTHQLAESEERRREDIAALRDEIRRAVHGTGQIWGN